MRLIERYLLGASLLLAPDGGTGGSPPPLPDPIADLHKELEAMNDAEVAQAAAARGLNTGLAPDRAAIAALIVADEKDKISKAHLAMLQDQEAAAAAKEAAPDAITAAIARLDRAFCADVPQGMGAGSFEPGDDDPRFGDPIGVSDGVYRRGGSDFLYTIKKRRLVSVTRATAGNKFGGPKVVTVNG